MNLTKDLISNFETIVDYQKKKNFDKSNTDVWHQRMPLWFSRLIKNNEIDWHSLHNFRKYGLLISETPHDPKNLLKYYIRKIILVMTNEKHDTKKRHKTYKIVQIYSKWPCRRLAL